ncbi:MAG: glycine hydroxymethyltransferase [Firmicutes bacterium]|nr:glycine hydroxymethyltransferase [Bacillota bacterium]
MSISPIYLYLEKTPPERIAPGFLAYLANLSTIATVVPEVASHIVRELRDQRENLKLIASENYSSLATQLAMGNLLTDKYAEGYPYHRFYAGCENVDAIEALAVRRACKLFGCDHAYVQPHSGADANLVAYWAVLNARVKTPALVRLGQTDPTKLSREEWNEIRRELGNQRLLAMDYYSGGHLTHGYRHNVSAQMFDVFTYKVNKETGLLDYDQIERQAEEVRPLILLAGYSAYPRLIDFRRLRAIADKVGAVLMVDMAHFAGLVAGGVFTGDYNPVAHAHIVTTTTHKTLRGPRGGMVLCTAEFAEHVDKGCPLVLGGPLPHILAAKAVALAEADTPEFRAYAHQVVANARALAEACLKEGLKVATGGTDNHLLLLDVTPFGLTGRQAEAALRECGITLNRNSLPEDPNGPWYTSGLRLGTPAATTLGMGEEEMREIARLVRTVLDAVRPEIKDGKPSKARYILDERIKKEVKTRVKELLARYPVYPELDLEFLEACFGSPAREPASQGTCL